MYRESFSPTLFVAPRWEPLLGGMKALDLCNKNDTGDRWETGAKAFTYLGDLKYLGPYHTCCDR